MKRESAILKRKDLKGGEMADQVRADRYMGRPQDEQIYLIKDPAVMGYTR